MMTQSEYGSRDALPELEKTLLWCARAWVIGFYHNGKFADDIHAAFERFGVEEAVDDLYGLMWALGRGALRTIHVNCVCYPGISADERMLLDAVALQQRDFCEDAAAVLERLMAEDAALIACDHARRLALAFSAAGRVFAAPSCDSCARRGFSFENTFFSYLPPSLH